MCDAHTTVLLASKENFDLGGNRNVARRTIVLDDAWVGVFAREDTTAKCGYRNPC